MSEITVEQSLRTGARDIGGDSRAVSSIIIDLTLNRRVSFGVSHGRITPSWDLSDSIKYNGRTNTVKAFRNFM
jgi:hypothetical protein